MPKACKGNIWLKSHFCFLSTYYHFHNSYSKYDSTLRITDTPIISRICVKTHIPIHILFLEFSTCQLSFPCTIDNIFTTRKVQIRTIANLYITLLRKFASSLVKSNNGYVRSIPLPSQPTITIETRSPPHPSPPVHKNRRKKGKEKCRQPKRK